MTAPLSPERIAEIRMENDRDDPRTFADYQYCWHHAQLARRALLAHVDHQAAEITKRDAEIEQLRALAFRAVGYMPQIEARDEIRRALAGEAPHA